MDTEKTQQNSTAVLGINSQQTGTEHPQHNKVYPQLTSYLVTKE